MFLLLIQLVPYNVQGKHFLVKTEDESSFKENIPDEVDLGADIGRHWGHQKKKTFPTTLGPVCVEPEDPLCYCNDDGMEVCA